MTDVFDRVHAMPVLNELLPYEPGAGSPFASDAKHQAISSYTAVRILLLEGMHRLQVAARTAQVTAMAELGGTPRRLQRVRALDSMCAHNQWWRQQVLVQAPCATRLDR